jgi:hypothetical protein
MILGVREAIERALLCARVIICHARRLDRAYSESDLFLARKSTVSGRNRRIMFARLQTSQLRLNALSRYLAVDRPLNRVTRKGYVAVSKRACGQSNWSRLWKGRSVRW